MFERDPFTGEIGFAKGPASKHRFQMGNGWELIMLLFDGSREVKFSLFDNKGDNVNLARLVGQNEKIDIINGQPYLGHIDSKDISEVKEIIRAAIHKPVSFADSHKAMAEGNLWL